MVVHETGSINVSAVAPGGKRGGAFSEKGVIPRQDSAGLEVGLLRDSIKVRIRLHQHQSLTAFLVGQGAQTISGIVDGPRVFSAVRPVNFENVTSGQGSSCIIVHPEARDIQPLAAGFDFFRQDINASVVGIVQLSAVLIEKNLAGDGAGSPASDAA